MCFPKTCFTCETVCYADSDGSGYPKQGFWVFGNPSFGYQEPSLVADELKIQY